MIIHKLREEPSKSGKLRILKSEATPLDLEMFDLAYNKQITMGVKFKDHDIDLTSLKPFSGEDRELLSKLSKRELTGHQARLAVETHSQTHGDLVKLICNQNLQCGTSVSLVNQAYPGTVEVFSVQLAKEVPLDKVKFPCVGELKYDGVRVTATYVKTAGKEDLRFRTRNGLDLHLPKSKERFLWVFRAAHVLGLGMLDMEVTLKGGTTEDRTTVSGRLNSARQGGTINEDLLLFNIFDCMSYDAFRLQDSKLAQPYSIRVVQLATLMKYVSHRDDLPIVAAKTHDLANKEEADELFKEYLKQGQEGLILKPYKHLYTFKRSKDWIKVKAIKSADLVCVGVIEGTGKYVGEIGALKCRGIVEDELVEVNVGSGLTDAQRGMPFTHYIGKTIEVKYNSLIQDSVTKYWSLFLPRFVTERFDK